MRRELPLTPGNRQGVDLRLPSLAGPPTFPWRHSPAATSRQRPATEVLAAARAAAEQPGAFLLGGGEPLRRADLVELIAHLAPLRPFNLGLCTFGYGITAALVQRLRDAGLHRVHVPVHCARQDAHDWLVGQPGALRTALRAIRTCVAGGLPVTADIVLSRPAAPHLVETVEVLARLGVRAINLRRLAAGDTDAAGFVALSPRLGLLEPTLERAAAVALERRVKLRLRDLPLCTAPRLRSLYARRESEAWVMPDGTVQACTAAGIGCPGCPESPTCNGAPPDYVARFGWEEFADRRCAAERLHETVTEARTAARAVPTAPMVFSWRGPPRVRCETCADAGDTLPPATRTGEPTRAIRARLVRAARYRPLVLQLVGADLLAHPRAVALVHDAIRLFRHVEVAAEASPTVDWSDLDLRRLRELRRLDVALYGPDAAAHDAHCGIPGAFAAMLRGVERLRAETAIPIGGYAVVHDARSVAAFATAWDAGRLPGSPRFRLSPRGGAMDELIECARQLPAGPARTALLAVLPRCLLCAEPGLGAGRDTADVVAPAVAARRQTVACGRPIPYRPRGSDPVGEFEPCVGGAASCGLPDCTGFAVGWQHNARSQRCLVTR
ncbi:radical SAM protein [Candidatus Binatia bacterium]|nr:radical SAM protein [Candidatus Binatia bacterium]